MRISDWSSDVCSSDLFLLPVLGSSVVIGMLAVSALNPLASALLSRYESLEASYMRNQESKLAVSESGLWLRQADDGGQSVIHAERVRPGSIDRKSTRLNSSH